MEIYSVLKVLFWSSLGLVFYSYFGYGILLYLIVKFKRIFSPGKQKIDLSYEPEVSFVVPCYNESEIIEEKVNNCLALDYPKHKLQLIFITDGSTDGTPDIIREKFPEVTVLHEEKRAGKTAAENRSMKYVNNSIVIFSDANTILPGQAIREIVKHYKNPCVGAVSGEKRILQKDKDSASGAGEGFYWKYESSLKKLDSELMTIVGAAGELFSFRKELFKEIEEDTILDDFVLSMRIAEQGYRVIYEPNAYAIETASASVREELKRKIRICAGGWQAMSRLKDALNPLNSFTLSFQYISHRILRWSVVPLLLLLLLPLNAFLFNQGIVYQAIFLGQVLFYLFAMVGWYLENRHIRVKILFIPYYFFIMNYAVFIGFHRFIKGKQSAAWERAKRGAVA